MVVIERKVKPKLNSIRKTFRNAKVGKSNQKKCQDTHLHKRKGRPPKKKRNGRSRTTKQKKRDQRNTPTSPIKRGGTT